MAQTPRAKTKVKAMIDPKSRPKPKANTKADPKAGSTGPSAAPLIDRRILDLGDWRGETLARMRALIREADPGVTEEWKWNNPVWSRGGIICTGEAYAKVVKLTFAKGAALPDPARLFNSSLGGNTRRAIDIREGEKVAAVPFRKLVKAAIALNGAPAGKAGARARGSRVKLLSGGNPQIAKADGDAPVQAYIAGMPGWKGGVGRRLDELIVRSVPGVRKAVKWNSPFYGVADRGWFLSFHVFTRYVKVAFFRGSSLRPVPPGASRQKDVRSIDIHENEPIDEALMRKWVKQAAALPGWIP